MPVYRDTANQIQYGVAGPGADPENTGPMQTMQVKARIPQKHGQDVLDDHLGFSNIFVPVGQQHVLSPVHDIGTVLVAMQTSAQPGSNLGLVAGVVPHVGNNKGQPGNSPLSFVFDSRKTGDGTKTVNSTKRNGAIWDVVEKGVQHSLSLLNMLPSHGASMPMAGIKNDGMNSVSTAKEKFDKVLNSDILSKMPGMSFNMGDLLNQMTGEQKDEMLSGMSEEAKGALENVLAIWPGSTGGDTGGFMTADKVNPEVFFQNAVEQFKGAKTVEDVMTCFQNLEDESMKGMDQYANTVIEIEGAFGNVNLQIDSSGKASLDIPDNIQSLIQSFASQMGALPGAGGGSGGMFNGSELKNMFDRLPKGEAQSFIETIQKHVDSGEAARSRLNNSALTALTGKQFPHF